MNPTSIDENNLTEFDSLLAESINNNELREAYVGYGNIINSEFLNGLDVESAKKKI